MRKTTKAGLSLLSIFRLASCHHEPSASDTVTPSVTGPAVTEPAPTTKPTENPTAKPTEKPTTKPTETPTTKPTEKPSASVSVAEKFAITIDAGEGVTITGLPEKASEGETVTFSVTLAAEKTLSYVTIDGENTLDPNENGTYSFVRPKRAVKVSAITADKVYANKVTQIEGATIAVSATSAKKGTTITVRVAVTDPNKVSPVVKAGDQDVTMAAIGDVSFKTFEGTFVQPGKDIDITVTLTNAPAKFAIVDKSGDGAVVSAPNTAAAGEKVSFKLSLEEGVEFDGDVKVYKQGDEETKIDVTKEEDGSYSFVRPAYAVVIERKTAASIFGINVEGDGDKIKATAVTCPQYATFGTKVTLTAKGNEEYLVDKVLVDGKEADFDTETNAFSFTRPSHAVTVKVVSKVHYYPVTLGKSDHITLSGFTYDEATKTYTPITDKGITYQDHVFVKATATKGEDGKEYAVDTIKTYRSESDFGTERILNADGYYESRSTTPSSDEFGVKIEVTEGEMVLKEDSILFGTHAGFNKSSSSGYASTESLVLNQLGKGKLGRSDVVTRSDFNETNKTFVLNQGSSSYKSGYFDSGLIYVNKSNYSVRVTDTYFYLSHAKKLTATNALLDNSYTYSSNNLLAEIGDGTKTLYGFVTKTNSTTLTVKNVTVVFRKEKSINTKGSIFEIKEGETSLGYFQNKDGVLTKYDVKKGSYTGDEGTLILDGFGTATLVKEDGKKEGSYVISGDYLALNIDGKDLFVKISESTDKNTYTPVDYTVGDFYGRKIDGDDDTYEWHLLNDFTTTVSSSYANSGTFNEKGQFTSNFRTLLSLSPDKKAFVMRYAKDYYLMSSDPDASYSSHIDFKNIGDKTSFVASISGTKDTKVVSSVYFDGTDFHWGTISDNKFTTAGTTFTFTESADKVFNLYNNAGKVGVIDGLAGTYINETLGNLVLDGKGTGKLGTADITYEINENKTLTVKTDAKTYIVTISGQTYTYFEVAESTVPAWLAGKTFFSKDAIQRCDEESYESFNENMGIVFSATERTLSCSVGTDASATKPLGGYYLNENNVAYTIEDGILTFELKGVEVKLTLDEANSSFKFVRSYDINEFTTVPSGTFDMAK